MNVIDQKLALEKLNSGYPIVFQTDTLPAIGCLPKFSEMIYKIKTVSYTHLRAHET